MLPEGFPFHQFNIEMVYQIRVFHFREGQYCAVLAHDRFHVQTLASNRRHRRIEQRKVAAAKRKLESLANRLLDLDGSIARENSTRNEEDTRQFEESMKNVNTKIKTKSDVNRVKKCSRAKMNLENCMTYLHKS